MSKKATTPKLAPKTAAPAPVPAKTTVHSRDVVLVSKTPKELATLIGENTPVKVSRKSLFTICAAKRNSDLKAELCL